LTTTERADPRVAGATIERLLGPFDNPAATAFLQFLSTLIDYLEEHHPERWSVTLFEDAIRLNGGWVECLVLHTAGVRVLVKESLAPEGTVFESEKEPYGLAPGCRVVSVEHGELFTTLARLQPGHQAALSTTAVRRPAPGTRAAHSPGVLSLLKKFRETQPAFAPQTDELASEGVRWEGDRRSVWVNRYERDAAARDACLKHHGLSCCVCGMTFRESYGEALAG
jgi:hypothetical protein